METRPVVLVTGAARRIGRAIALELAAHGWAVAVHGRHSVEEGAETVALIQAAGGRAQAFAADLGDEAQCNALVPAVLAAFGRVDALVNNASVFEYDDVATFTHAAMEQAWRINTAPAILLARGLHATLQDAPGERQGVVINLLDQKLAHPHPDHLSYTLSKVALQAATTMLAQALAPRLRVCAVAPGVTLNSGNMTDTEFAAAHRMTPLQRSSGVDDIARAVRFLVDSPAITGVTLMVDGGQHLLAQARDVMFLAREPQHPEKPQ